MHKFSSVFAVYLQYICTTANQARRQPEFFWGGARANYGGKIFFLLRDYVIIRL